eukprot:TRINITY_DN2333_c0_g1_i4.p2 TRINITY_DN2333_c0_g1~~TRINITY_DN2333_c0_g1_i4.p2  ORF type:complete len:199 (-),score=34.72 TRINITY_DN2333_c0_g1_i4:41-637(-)
MLQSRRSKSVPPSECVKQSVYGVSDNAVFEEDGKISGGYEISGNLTVGDLTTVTFTPSGAVTVGGCVEWNGGITLDSTGLNQSSEFTLLEFKCVTVPRFPPVVVVEDIDDACKEITSTDRATETSLSVLVTVSDKDSDECNNNGESDGDGGNSELLWLLALPLCCAMVLVVIVIIIVGMIMAVRRKRKLEQFTQAALA